MFCHSCGKKINEDDRFCAYCGAKVKNLVEDDLHVSEVKNEPEKNNQETTSTIKNFAKKIWHGFLKFMFFMLILSAGAFGKALYRSADPDFHRQMNYILPSLFYGIVGGIICILIEEKIKNLNNLTILKTFSFILCIILGIIGGIKFVICGILAILSIAFIISKF